MDLSEIKSDDSRLIEARDAFMAVTDATDKVAIGLHGPEKMTQQELDAARDAAMKANHTLNKVKSRVEIDLGAIVPWDRLQTVWTREWEEAKRC